MLVGCVGGCVRMTLKCVLECCSVLIDLVYRVNCVYISFSIITKVLNYVKTTRNRKLFFILASFILYLYAKKMHVTLLGLLRVPVLGAADGRRAGVARGTVLGYADSQRE